MPKILPKVQRVAAYGLVLRDGQILLTRLARRISADERWHLPGGGVDHGEDPRDALVREIREETGLLVEVGPILEVSTGFRWARVEIVFAFRVTGGTPALTAEVAELGWFTPDGLPDVRADQRGLIERNAGTAREWAGRP
jgi:8-oxo-dGTP pyrophosphatase MutT (NUDIX family)